jgi:dTDP-glucose pyrophosphorylase
MNIIMGMCGEGSRFRDVGYTIPKYLIAYKGKTMLQHSVDTLKIPGEWYFVARQDHIDNNPTLLPMLEAMGTVIISPGLTEGAAQSLLLAKDYIRDTDKPMMSVNCDQYLRYDPTPWIKRMNDNPDTSYILTFPESDPKCSYVRKDDTGSVVEVREKQVISFEATVGVYHWSKTSDFFTDCEQMISEGVKDNNEYYVAPVYNYSIKRGLKVETHLLRRTEFYPVGTPHDLRHFYGTVTDFE